MLHVLPCVLANTYRFAMKDLSQHHLQVIFEAIMTSVVSAANQPRPDCHFIVDVTSNVRQSSHYVISAASMWLLVGIASSSVHLL